MTALILDLLGDLGRTALPSVWAPVAVWTAIGVPVAWGVVSWTSGPVLLRYRLVQATLLALPVGLLVSAAAPPFSPAALLPAASSPPPGAAAPAPSLSTVPMSAPPPPLPPILFQGLGLLTIAVAAAGVVGVIRFALDVRRGAMLRSRLSLKRSSRLQQEVARIGRQLGLRRQVRARWSDANVVPMAFGTVHPTIVLPCSLREEDTQRHLALIHELTHLRRYDDVSAATERFLQHVFVVHPLVRRVSGWISQLREQACDAAVLSETRSDRATYAALLLSFVERPAPAGDPLFLFESSSSLKTRLQTMSTPSPSLSRPVLWLATGTLSLFLIAGITACSDSVTPAANETHIEAPASPSSATNDPISDPDTPARPRGGMQAVYQSIEYPEVAAEAGIEGRVFVEFVVDASGSVTDARAMSPESREATSHPALQKAAVEAVRSVSFTPGRKNGEPVATRMTLPVTFRLDGASDETASDRSSATTSSAGTASRAASSSETDETLFEKAGIQVLKVLVNRQGDILLNDEPVALSGLADAAREKIRKDAVRAVIIPDADAPPETIRSVEAQLHTLSLQKVYRQDSDS
jgi:TonB family protein